MRLIGILSGVAAFVAACLPLRPPVGLTFGERCVGWIAGAGAVAIALWLPDDEEPVS